MVICRNDHIVLMLYAPATTSTPVDVDDDDDDAPSTVFLPLWSAQHQRHVALQTSS
jgi:hypothetical protein